MQCPSAPQIGSDSGHPASSSQKVSGGSIVGPSSEASGVTTVVVMGPASSETSASPAPESPHAATTAQLTSVRETIINGNPGGLEDPDGADPVDMPAWGDELTDEEIDAVIAYAISLFDWEE